jgi:hypothetical protein
LFGMGYKVRVTSPTKGRGRELFKERHVFRVRETND